MDRTQKLNNLRLLLRGADEQTTREITDEIRLVLNKTTADAIDDELIGLVDQAISEALAELADQFSTDRSTEMNFNERIAELRERARTTRNADEVQTIYADIARLERSKQVDKELRAPAGSWLNVAKPAFEIRAGETDAEFRVRAARELATRAL